MVKRVRLGFGQIEQLHGFSQGCGSCGTTAPIRLSYFGQIEQPHGFSPGCVQGCVGSWEHCDMRHIAQPYFSPVCFALAANLPGQNEHATLARPWRGPARAAPACRDYGTASRSAHLQTYPVAPVPGIKPASPDSASAAQIFW